jgi:hypothetical protein
VEAADEAVEREVPEHGATVRAAMARLVEPPKSRRRQPDRRLLQARAAMAQEAADKGAEALQPNLPQISPLIAAFCWTSSRVPIP